MDSTIKVAVRKRVCGRCAKTVQGYVNRDPSVATWIAELPGKGCPFCLPTLDAKERQAEREAARAMNQHAAPDAE